VTSSMVQPVEAATSLPLPGPATAGSAPANTPAPLKPQLMAVLPAPRTPPAHMPPIRKAFIGEEERKRWKELGGKMVEALLCSGAVAVLDAAWLVALAEKGGVLRRRQDTPDEAFLCASEVKAAGCPLDSLPIIIVSAPWLTPRAPDPRGHSLRTVARALKILIEDGKRRGRKKAQRWGVVWDYASLHQQTNIASAGEPIWERSAEEEELFTRGLAAYGALYMHQHITCLLVTKLPPGYPLGYNVEGDHAASEYWERGWCHAELSWSILIKRHTDLVLDLGKMSGVEIDKIELVKKCSRIEERLPPMMPDEVSIALEAKSFSDATRDRPLVTRLYAEVFGRMLGRVRVLHYTSLRWGDAELLQLCRVLKSGALVRLEGLHLCGNRFGDAGLNALAAVVSCGALPLLSQLTTDRPNFVDLRAACEARQIGLTKDDKVAANGVRGPVASPPRRTRSNSSDGAHYGASPSSSSSPERAHPLSHRITSPAVVRIPPVTAPVPLAVHAIPPSTTPAAVTTSSRAATDQHGVSDAAEAAGAATIR